MSIVNLLAAAQGGQFFASAGKASGLSVEDAREAVTALAPAIAAKLKAKAAADEDAFDTLLDLLEDGDGSADLNDADAMTGAEALADGREILADLYGSPSAAAATLGKLAPSVAGDQFDRISAISATSVLASLAAANANTLAAPGVAASDGGGAKQGLIGIIIAALLKGLLQGASRQLAPRRRRRRSYRSYYGSRTRRRRTRRPGLEDLFKDILTRR